MVASSSSKPPLEPEECILWIRKLLAKPPELDKVPLLDNLLSEATVGINRLRHCHERAEQDDDRNSYGNDWAKHVLQLTREHQRLHDLAFSWRAMAIAPKTLEAVMVPESPFPSKRISLECERDVEKLRQQIETEKTSSTIADELCHAMGSLDPHDAFIEIDDVVKSPCQKFLNSIDLPESSVQRPARHRSSSLDELKVAGEHTKASSRHFANPKLSLTGEHRNGATRRAASPKSTSQSQVVELAMYDLAKGAVKFLPLNLLTGQKWEAIWHCGVRCFGFEFWFGGDIIQAMPEVVPFGTPIRVVKLGSTQRTYRELRKFIGEELSLVYTKDSYDGLRKNCNHFSNELVRFLLRGKQIPEEVRNQVNWYRELKILRPVLMPILGGSTRARPTSSQVAESGSFPIMHPSSSPTLMKASESSSLLECCSAVKMGCSRGLDSMNCSGPLGITASAPSRPFVHQRTQARQVSRERTLTN